MQYIALVVVVFQLTGQWLAVAGLAAAEILPVLLFGPIARGRLRYDRGRICRCGRIAQHAGDSELRSILAARRRVALR
jgi:hypothetical protein